MDAGADGRQAACPGTANSDTWAAILNVDLSMRGDN
jgi:hypothetical protein